MRQHAFGAVAVFLFAMTRLKRAEIDAQILRTSTAIRSATGVAPRLIRPPYGARNAKVDQAAARAGLAEVLWDVDTLDWKKRNAKSVNKRVFTHARRGSIVLMHDIHPTTVAAIPSVVRGLRLRGYTLVTISELLGQPIAGRPYFRAG